MDNEFRFVCKYCGKIFELKPEQVLDVSEDGKRAIADCPKCDRRVKGVRQDDK